MISGGRLSPGECDLGVEPHVIEALVNHVGGSARAGVAGVYNRSA